MAIAANIRLIEHQGMLTELYVEALIAESVAVPAILANTYFVRKFDNQPSTLARLKI
jgi:hypothetical protein